MVIAEEIVVSTIINNSTESIDSSSLTHDDEVSNNSIKAPVEHTQQSAAPQLKFAEDGSIIINEESLIIQRQEVAPVYDSTVVEGEQVDNLTYISYRKFHHTKKWTERGLKIIFLFL